tara:strand:+ start:235 stop:909 length:675 start_codon:yes stop_codon:yes gene_type:complete
MFKTKQDLIDSLTTNDYLTIGNIEADWKHIYADCEKLAEENTSYWRPDMGESYDAWDEAGKKFKKYWDSFGEYGLTKSNGFVGYNKHNTRHWENTASKPTLKSDWMESIVSKFPLTLTGCRIMMQPPGNTMPWHVDNFWNLRQAEPENSAYAIRFIVFPQDWQTGHLLQAGNTFISHWKAGDVVCWHPDKWHLSANVGVANKWTFNVTGILENELDWADIIQWN